MIGKVVSHYRILEKIGEGAMGVVYRAEDLKLKRTVALKFLPQELTRQETAKQRFVREAQAVASLEHPNVCTVHEISEAEDGQLYICMSYCRGMSLKSRLTRGPLSVPEAIYIAKGICSGLARAHERGIIHRDIKPSNIMINDQNEVTILDFGVAKQVGSPTLTTLTSTGMAVGTPAYMAPEQAAGLPIDHRVDIWALGVVLYESVTGDRPFAGDSVGELMQAICGKEPKVAPLRDDVQSPGLSTVILRCLAKKASDRYESAQHVLDDLDDISSVDNASSARSRAFHLPHRTGRLIGATAAVAAIILGILVVWLINRSSGSVGIGEVVPILAVLDFENLSEPDDAERFGQILQELVITDLSGISSLKVLSSERLLGVQKQLGYTGASRVNREVAGEVCRRAGAGKMLSGTVMKLGEQWTLTAQLIDVASGAVLNSQRIDGTDLYTMVDEVSGRVRENLRLPHGTADYIDVAVGEKTTTSMDAYRHYLLGVELLDASAFARSVFEFERAVEIDPSFNQAYYKMALAQWWSDDVTAQQGRDAIARILENRRYTSDRERRLAEGALALIDRRFTDALAIYEDMVVDYADDKEVYFVLGLAYSHESDRVNRDKALAAFQKAIELDLTFVLAYRGLFDVYVTRRNYTKAIELARNLITIKPESPVGYRYLVEAAICRGDSAQVNVALKQALQHHNTPEELQGLYYHVGLAYNRVADQPRSEFYTRKALALDPETSNYRIFAQLADALFNQRENEAARHFYQKGLELNPLSSWCLGGLWYVAMRERKYDEATRHASRLVTLRPQEPRRHGELLRSFVASHRYAEAEDALDAGLKAIPSTAGRIDLLVNAAEAYMDDNRHSKAAILLRRAEVLDRSGEVGSVYFTLAVLQNQEREYDRARHYAEKALASGSGDPLYSGALHELFHSHLYNGDVDEAIAVAKRRIDARPHIASSYTDLAQAYINMGRYADADTLLRVALRADSLRTLRQSLLAFLGECYLRVDELGRANEYLQQALEVSPVEKRTLRSLALLREQQGRYKDAEHCYRAILDQEPNDVRALQQLGHLFMRQNATDEAGTWYRRALTVDKDDPETLRGLSLLLARTHRWEEALQIAKMALDRDPSFFSLTTLAWILVDGETDLPRGIRLAEEALDHPPFDDPTDEYLKTKPFVPLPYHVLGLAHLKQGSPQEALALLKRAAGQRPKDRRIADDLEEARRLTRG